MLKRWTGTIMAAVVLLPASLSAAGLPQPPAGTYDYTIRHSKIGKIGSYKNIISYQGDEAVVETEIDINAKILFIRVAQEKAERRQVWRNGRLQALESVTWAGKEKFVTSGRATPAGFVITGPSGEETTSASVFPTSPWSAAIVKATTLVNEKRGQTYSVTLTGNDSETVDVLGQKVETRHYKFSGHKDDELWFDARGVAVKFSLKNDGDTITFTLAGEQPATL